MSKRKAMIEAGYSISTANQAKRVIQTNSMKGLTENLLDSLIGAGISAEFLANKFVEWLNAENSDKPDYNTQIGAFDRLIEIFKGLDEGKEKKSLRRLTVEEWINQDN